MAVSSIFFSIIILLSLFINVKSDFSFNFPTFGPQELSQIGFANDATAANGVIQLTKKDQSGNPLPHSVGQVGFIKPIQIYDRTSGKVADFVTEFSFVVSRKESSDHGDGVAFFLVPQDFQFPNKTKSSGGYLGMFTPENAFSSKDQIVMVEFDSYDNTWDPFPVSEVSHIGIDVSSIRSVATEYWYVDFKPDGSKATARISHDSKAKKLSVSVSYDDKSPVNGDSSIVSKIDLRNVLPEHVLIGFSAATGDSVETHDILSWSFTSNL